MMGSGKIMCNHGVNLFKCQICIDALVAEQIEKQEQRITDLEQQLRVAKADGVREAFRRGFIEGFIHLDNGTCTYKEQNEAIRVSNLKADKYANSLEGK